MATDLSSESNQPESRNHLNQSGLLFLLRLFGVALQFLLTYTLTHVMNQEAYSIFAYTYSWIAVLLLFPVMGGDLSALKIITLSRSKASLVDMKGFAVFNLYHILCLCSVIAIIVSITLWLSSPHPPPLRAAWIAGLFLLPVLSIFQLGIAWLQAFERITTSYILQFIGRPLGVLLLSGMFWFITPPLQAAHVLIATSCCCVLLLGAMIRLVPGVALKRFIQHPYHYKKSWFQLGVSLSLVNGLLMIQARTDILMLGTLLDTSLAGPYSVATQLAALVSFGLLVTTAIVSPRIAPLHESGKYRELQKELVSASRIGSLLATILIIPLLLFPAWFLSLFNPEFSTAAPVLSVLSLATLMSVMTGLPLNVLMLCGYEKKAASILIITCILNVVLNAISIPLAGAEGAALSTLITTLIRSIWLLKTLQSYMALRTDVLA